MSIAAVAVIALKAKTLETIIHATKDFLQDDLPRIAKDYEKKLNDQLATISPGDEFLDGLMVGGSEFAGLGGGGKENVLGGEALAEEALADGEEVVAGGGVVLLEAENEAQLRGGVGRRFDDVLDDGFAGGVLEFALGFKSGEGAGEEEEGG